MLAQIQRPSALHTCACLVAPVLLSGCAAPLSARAFLDRGQYRAACAFLSINHETSDPAQKNLDREREELTRRVARDSNARLSFHALDSAEVARSLGEAPLASARYGEQILIVVATLDASRSRVPVDFQADLSWADGMGEWTAANPSAAEADEARLALFGSRVHLPEVSLDMARASGPSSGNLTAGKILLHVATGGITYFLLPFFEGRARAPDGLRLPLFWREHDEDLGRRAWSPVKSAPPWYARPSELLKELEGLNHDCRAEPGSTCRLYLVVLRRAGKGLPKHGGVLDGRLTFHVEPQCAQRLSGSWALPPETTLVDSLRMLEAAGPVLVQAPSIAPQRGRAGAP